MNIHLARLDNYSSAKKAAICLCLIHRQIQSSVWKMRFVVFWITSFQLWPKFFSKVTNLVLSTPTSAGYGRGASYSYFALLSTWEQIYTYWRNEDPVFIKQFIFKCSPGNFVTFFHSTKWNCAFGAFGDILVRFYQFKKGKCMIPSTWSPEHLETF